MKISLDDVIKIFQSIKQLEAENKRLKEALRWIIGACGEPKAISSCPRCGRPTGIPAIAAHAKQALKGDVNG